MVFYYFGPDPSSWAFGNDRFALANNLPEPIRKVWDQLGQPFQDKQLAGTLIQWMTSASDGRYAIQTKQGQLLSNCNDMLDAVKKQLQMSYIATVSHVSFSPLGGWFVSYSDGTIQLSGHFPDGFYTLAAPHLELTGPAAQSTQRSMIRDVFFGGGESVLIKTSSSSMLWANLPEDMAQVLDTLNDVRVGGTIFSLGPGTTLCPWSNEYYFIEALPIYGVPQFPFKLPTGLVTQELLVQITQNIKPPDNLIPSASINGSPAPAQVSALPSPQNNKPSPAPRPSNIPAYLSPPAVPVNMRHRYEREFDHHSGGRPHLTGSTAAHILLSSGLERKVLSEIWELTDEDKNGQLEKEEFVQAMWQVDTRLTGDKTKIRWADNAITCDGCSSGLNVGEDTFFCPVCGGGDFDLCQVCYADASKRCQHELCQVTIQLPNNVQYRDIVGDSAYCDGCTAGLPNGTNVYFCQICNGGDYDLCELCWKSQKTCGHALILKVVKAFCEPPGTASAPTTEPIAAPTVSDYTMPPSLQGWDTPYTTPSPYGGNQPSFGEPSEMDKLGKKFMDTSLKESLLSSIVSEKPNIKWEDVAGLEAAKAELQEAIIFPLRFPQMFRGKRQARRALLLYGPPGTGKSYLAKAVATEVDHTLFSISSGDVMSKWMGESEGLMRQLFVLAREKKPSIIFIDELDALCGKRDGNGANAEDTARMKTEFLVQMDGLGNNNDGVFVLAATNLPWALDPAVRRRFQKRIHVPLPDEAARSELFKVHLGDMSASLGNTDMAFWDLARRTEGFSGSDIANLVQDALMMPIRKVHTATHFRKLRDQQGEWFTPCNAVDSGAMPMRWNQVPAKQLKEPPLSIADLFAAVGNTKPSVGEEEVLKCSEWTQQYGMEGA